MVADNANLTLGRIDIPARARESLTMTKNLPPLSRLLLTGLILMTIAAAPAPKPASDPSPKLSLALPKWGLVIHGGAGAMDRAKMDPEKEKAARAALDQALAAGTAILAAGGSAVDAVEAAVIVLEDDPNFNAGRGAVLTYEGGISLDAAIMDGKDRAAGAVAGTQIAKNPIKAARRVMTDGPHVLLSGTGADQFVIDKGLETADQSYFETPERRKQLEELKNPPVNSKGKKGSKTGWFDVDVKYGTVGAVALDLDGHVAAATSTGGLTGKRWGRIGDSPLIGAGTYADDRACAVSATGAGEYFIREGVAHEICARVRLKGEKIVPAARSVLADVKTMGGTGGVILITPDGQIGWSFNTKAMYRGAQDSSGRKMVAIYGDE
jgi:L-asparaginase / beta-aspartyl-peptidase